MSIFFPYLCCQFCYLVYFLLWFNAHFLIYHSYLGFFKIIEDESHISLHDFLFPGPPHHVPEHHVNAIYGELPMLKFLIVFQNASIKQILACSFTERFIVIIFLIQKLIKHM